MARPSRFKIGSWIVRPAQNLLQNRERSIRIEPRAMDVLSYLASRPGDVISISELLAVVWKGAVVGDGSVYFAIAQLRQALAVPGNDTAYIETIPKRGYRLAVPVERAVAAETATEAAEPSLATSFKDSSAASSWTSLLRASMKRTKPLVIAGAGAAAALALVALVAVGTVYPLSSPPSSTSRTADTFASLGAYEITQLTTTGNTSSAALTPDGRYVVYGHVEPTLPARSSISMRHVSSASTARIVSSELDALVFAPTVTRDGVYVDFIRAAARSTNPALWRVPLLGGPARHFVDNVWSPVGWSPNGDRMAFVRRDETLNITVLIVADADGNNQRQLVTRRPPRYLLHFGLIDTPMIRPAWSPDGRVIALFDVDVDRGLGSRVVFVDSVTGEEVASYPSGHFARGLAWLGPDSLILSQAASLGRPVQLWRMSYQDGELTPLTNDLTSYVDLDIDSARGTVVTLRRDVKTSLWVGDAAGLGREILPPSTFSGMTPWVGWAGGRVLYGATAAAGGPSIVAIVPEADAANEIVPEEIVPAGMLAAGTHDGTAVVFHRDGSLWKLTDDSNDSAVLLTEGAYHAVTAGGDQVVFIRSSGIQAPWIVPLEGGEPQEIVREFAAAGSVDVSGDGRLLFRSSTQLVTCDLPACTNRRELRWPQDSSLSRNPRWMPDGKAIAYVDENGSNIWATPLAGGPRRQITHFEPTSSGTAIASFAWSPDGERLAVVHSTETWDVVLLRAH